MNNNDNPRLDDNKPFHTADLIMKLQDVKGNVYENIDQNSYLRHLAMIEALLSDSQAITNEYHYFFRFWWFDDEKIREQMIMFKRKEGITDFGIKFLRFTGHLKINEEEVDYNPDPPRPWMGWSFIFVVTIQMVVDLLHAYTIDPDLAQNPTPHFQLFSAWALFFGTIYLFFIAPSNYLKRRKVY